MKPYSLQKKAFSVFLTAIMLLTLLPCFAAAQAEDEVIITTAEQIISLAYSQNKDDFSKNYRLANDIDMTKSGDERPMKAIGSNSGGFGDFAFTGCFNGDGHKIINLSTTGEALFGYVESEGYIQNLTLENAAVHFSKNESNKYPAALVSLNKGTVQSCMSINSTVLSDYCSPAGGLIGTNFGTVSLCGVFGGSVNFTVSKTGTSHGGFVGNQRGGVIEACFSTAVVNAKKWAGGFAGKIEEGVISDCYALGDVNGSEECGGFAGAFLSDAQVKNCYAANSVTAQNGGLFGGKGFSFATAGTPENCWFNRDILTLENSENFTNDPAWGKTTEQMKSAQFAALLSDKWAYNENINGGYPYLIHAVPPAADDAPETVTAQMMIAAYDKDDYKFYKLSEPFVISVQKNTVTVKDVMEAAEANESFTYAFGKNEQSGQIVTINGITPNAPDGWMFSVNGIVPSVGADAAKIADGDKLMWYVGTPENGYLSPAWDEVGESGDGFTNINTAEELTVLSQSPDMWGGKFQLSENIDMAGIDFSPIGNSENPFTGTFDGNGYEIQNLTVSGDKNSQNIGMFGVIRGAKLKNIILRNVQITGGSIVGGLVGTAKSDASAQRISLISGCRVSGTVTATGNSYAKQTDAGGLAGINDSEENTLSGKVFASAIDNCSADVTVTGDTGAADLSDAGHIGGLVGLNNGTISNSAASGRVTGGNTTGGLVGFSNGSIYASSARGTVSGAYSIGGFVGSAGLYSLIENSYSTGDVTALGEHGANFGGFAGSACGKLKNCISSGTLHTGWSYNGGFAGKFDGTVWSYNDGLRSVSGCYGNTTASDGKTIKPLGNYIGGIHAPTDLAAEAIGVSKETANQKIEALLNSGLAENRLKNEAKKYKTRAVVPATVQKNSDITVLVAKLNANVSADSEISVSYGANDSVIAAGPAGYMLNSRPEKDTEETVTLSFLLNGVNYEQPISVKLYSEAKQVDKNRLLKTIAEGYAKTGADYWEVVTASAYNSLFGGAEISDNVKTSFIAQAVTAIAESDIDTTIAMNILALRSLGFNPEDITNADGTKINALEKLANLPSTGNNGDAYKLLAYHACGYDKKADTDAVIERLLQSQLDNSGWSNNTDDGIDADTTGAVLLGLSAHYNTNAAVKTAADSAVDYLSTLMQTDGNIKSSYKESNYGTNANTSAICAMGLEALGIDINSDIRFVKNSVSLYDGIMSFASGDETGFVYDYESDSVNPLATKQAALAIMAAEKNGNILDFSNMPGTAINLQKAVGGSGSGGHTGGSSGGASKPSDKAETQKIDVFFTLVGDSVHGEGKHINYVEWLSDEKIEVKENASAREVIEQALNSRGYIAKGFENGYISEITTPGGIVLGEYSNGEKSGWMYMVNGEAPSVGINDYKVKSGDKIKVYYLDSWETASFVDVTPGDWFSEAAEYAAQNELIKGNENGEFMPDALLTRAMAVTVLYRFSGEQTEVTDTIFSDVSKSDWFAPAVVWAAKNGITDGLGDGSFAPNDSITREQLALMLYRFVKHSETIETPDTGLSAFTDENMVSAWAKDAVCWAVQMHIINGMDDRTLAPQATATRAQFAMILMNLSHLTK